MKFLKLLFFLLILFLFLALKIEIRNPNLRPYRIYVENFGNKKGEPISELVLSNFKLLPNLEFVNNREESDYTLNMSVQDETFQVQLTNVKSGEFFNIRLHNFESDLISNGNLLSDRIYERMTQTKGIFSTKIVFSLNWHGTRQIFLADIRGKAIKKLTANKRDSIAPKISFTRKFIAYTEYLPSAGTALRLIDLDTLQDKVLYSSKDLNLAGSFDKDDEVLYFVSFNGKVSKIYELSLKNFNRKEIYTSRSRIVSPVTTFKKDEIAFVSDEGGSPQIYLLNIAEKRAKRITYSTGYSTSPSFVREGTHFVYLGQSQGINNVFISSIDGSDFLPLTHGRSNFEDPLWLANERFILTYVTEGNNSSIILIDIPTQKRIQLFKIPAKINYLSAN